MILEESLQKGVQTKMVNLPPLSLNTMTKTQLVDFVPNLISLVTGKSPPLFGKVQCKPVWWPVDIPWKKPSFDDAERKEENSENGLTETLRRIVKSCYQHMGSEDLLSKKEDTRSSLVARNTACSNKILAEKSSMNKSSEGIVCNVDEIEIKWCCICNCQFEGQDNLCEHQSVCMGKQVENFMDQSSSCPNSSNKNVSLFNRHCSAGDRENWLIRSRAGKSSLKHSQRLGSQTGYLSQTGFLKTVGLLPTSQANRVKSNADKPLDIDCEIIAVEGVENRPLTSPRTPKSLMSQLSRDGDSSSRKRLSFSLPDDQSDNDEPETASRTNIQGALLGVPFSSLLGRRIKKHIKVDNTACTVNNPEEFCKTPVRNEFLEKLRFRQTDYPVTFKQKRKYAKYSHEYKFSEVERREFIKRVRTGLNKRSRHLKNSMKKCQVMLKRVTKEEIEMWKQRIRSYEEETWIDDDITIVQVEHAETDYGQVYPCGSPVANWNIRPSMKINNSCGPVSLLGRRNPQLNMLLNSDQRQYYNVTQPRPQFLVKKVEKQFNGQQSSKLVFVPLGNHKMVQPRQCERNMQQHLSKTWEEQNLMLVDRRSLSRSRRKQNLTQIRRDLDNDDISVKSLSSEDDDDDSFTSGNNSWSLYKSRNLAQEQKQRQEYQPVRPRPPYMCNTASVGGGAVVSLSPKPASTVGQPMVSYGMSPSKTDPNAAVCSRWATVASFNQNSNTRSMRQHLPISQRNNISEKPSASASSGMEQIKISAVFSLGEKSENTSVIQKHSGPQSNSQITSNQVRPVAVHQVGTSAMTMVSQNGLYYQSINSPGALGIQGRSVLPKCEETDTKKIDESDDDVVFMGEVICIDDD